MRAYASLATSSSSSSLSEQWQQAGPSTSSLTPSRNLSASSAAVETQALAVIARDLLNLLITATGKTPGKQRLVAWPDTEGGPDEEEEWVRRLESVISRTDLANKVAPRTVIAVLSSSSLEAAEFSQALLSDPLASDQAHSKLLADRSKTTDFNVRKDHIYSLVYDTPAQHSPDDNAAADQANMSRIPSQFLRKNNVELREIVYNHSQKSMSPSIWTAILTSDVIVVLSEPLAPSDQYRLLQKPNVFHVRASQAHASDARIFESALPASQESDPSRQVVEVDIARALQANNLLLTNGPSSLAHYSNLSIRAGIPQLTEHLSALASEPDTQLQMLQYSLARLRLDLASSVAGSFQTLYEAEAAVGRLALRSARDKKHSEIELGFTDLDKLDLEQLVTDSPPTAARQRTSRIATMAYTKSPVAVDHHDNPAISSKPEADEDFEQVTLLEDGSKGVKRALEHPRLRWWKLPLGRADDVAAELAAGLALYFGDLERKLIFETGRLSERAFDLSLQVDHLLNTKPFAKSGLNCISLYSAKMINEITALSPTTQFGFPPPAHPSAYNLSQTSLSSPILTRRDGLKAPGGPIEKLQLRAQQAVIQFYSLSGLSAAAAIYLNQTDWLTMHQELPFCVGLTGLGISIAAWRLQGSWKKAKGKFWTDWKRAQDSLAADLQANASNILDTRVFIKADTANRLLRRTVHDKKTALKELEMNVQKLKLATSSS